MNEPLIDVNVYLGQWPTRRLPGDDTASLAERLKRRGVTEAWAGSFDGLFHQDLASVNDRLASECRKQTAVKFVPFGEINVLHPNWERELTRCHEALKMPGVRLHPNYHGYGLDHAEVVRLLAAAAERKMIVALTPLMEDARMMHPRLRVDAVNLDPLPGLLKETPGVRLLLLNALRRSVPGDKLHALVKSGDVFFDIAMLEGVAGIETELKDVPLERILFGSFSPSFYFEAALLKLQESPLGHHQRRAIMHNNARRLLPTSNIT